MLDDLDRSLRDLLDDLAAPATLQAADVAFDAPVRGYAPPRETVNLFAHDLRENRDLRDPVPVVEIVAGMARSRRPPLRVDCAYMVTAWSSDPNAAQRVQREHRLLSLALLWLGRHPEIPPANRVGTLAPAVHPPPVMTAQAEGPATGPDFWNALGIAPRPSFRLSVTIELDLADVDDLGPPVTTAALRLYELPDLPPGSRPRESTFRIAGVVTSRRDGLPLGGATVTVEGRPGASTTGADGRFTLAGLPAGAHTLRTTHPSHPPESTAITVPAPAPDGYDHALGP